MFPVYFVTFYMISWVCVKDTVSTNKQDDEVNGNKDSRKDWPSIGHNAIVHNASPVLSSENLSDS